MPNLLSSNPETPGGLNTRRGAKAGRCLATTLSTAALVMAGACDSPLTGCISTFETIQVTVVDSLGQPVPQAGIASVLTLNEDTLFASPIGDSPTGRYTVLTDGALPALHPGGNAVEVTVTTPSARRAVAYIFDAPAGCHVHKVRGPDRITVP